MPFLRNPQCFERSENTYRCLICKNHTPQLLRDAARHEDSQQHVYNLWDRHPDRSSSPIMFDDDSEDQATSSSSMGSVHGPAIASDPPDQLYLFETPQLHQDERTFILQGALDPEQSLYSNTVVRARSLLSSPPLVNDSERDGECTDESSELVSSELDRYGEELSDEAISSSESECDASDQSCASKSGSTTATNIKLTDEGPWAPWGSKEECIFSMPWAFPRHAPSEQSYEGLRWTIGELYGRRTPSSGTIHRVRSAIHGLVGNASRDLVGIQCKNRYTIASIEMILTHEVANPEVRPFLHLYPEDAGKKCCGPWNAQRWLSEVPPHLSGPMVRVHGHDYYVNEPCLAETGEQGDLVPLLATRWVKREGGMWGIMHRLEVCGDVYQISDHLETPVNRLVLPFPLFKAHHASYNLPPPKQLCQHETLLDLAENEWRIRACGRMCFVLPLWLYCDDTSGNVSKKWNEHNSVLMCLAGLQSSHLSLPFEIHFLTTSNLAPPTEMFEGVSDEMRKLQANGFVAFDCTQQADALFIPWVYAFQADNPMQSEGASHIGLNGNLFCRVCKVHCLDLRKSAGVDQMVDSAAQFMHEGEYRSKADTLSHLYAQLDTASRGYSSKLVDLQRDSGVKDCRFTDLLEAWHAEADRVVGRTGSKGVTNAQRTQRAKIMAERRAALPSTPFNPLLELDDFDPNLDSPVEVLHVILLGVVKYFWRDAVNRLMSSQRSVLVTRLSSFNTSGLGIPSLRGQILVQYAGSLVGRDFRAVVQVAPAVLYNLLPAHIYDAWLALCRVVPLAFQSEIDNIDEYCDTLQLAIGELLKAAARWSIRWLNKPKFHLLLHLPTHIRRFGPAPFFSTEGFESQNAVIRLQSVHSNRSAPSKDITSGFSFIHAVRHLVCGGWYRGLNGQYRQAGVEIRRLFENARFRGFIGAAKLRAEESNMRLKSGVAAWHCTTSSQFVRRPPDLHPNTQLRRCRSIQLPNGDRVNVRDFILIHPDFLDTTSRKLAVGDVLELLFWKSKSSSKVLALVQLYDTGECVPPYRYPRLTTNETLGVEFMDAEQFVATVNTFHNCAHHDCAIEQTRVVWQERLENSALKGFTVHHSNNQDRIINLAQMRSAALLCHFNGSYVFSEIGFRQSALVGVNSFRAGTNVVSGSPK